MLHVEASQHRTAVETEGNKLILLPTAKTMHMLSTHCTNAMSETHSTTYSLSKLCVCVFVCVSFFLPKMDCFLPPLQFPQSCHHDPDQDKILSKDKLMCFEFNIRC